MKDRKRLFVFKLWPLLVLLVVICGIAPLLRSEIFRTRIVFKEVENSLNSELMDIINVDLDGDGHDEIIRAHRFVDALDQPNNHITASKYLSFAFSQINIGRLTVSGITKSKAKDDGSEAFYVSLMDTTGNSQLLSVSYSFTPEGRQRFIRRIDYQPQFPGMDIDYYSIMESVDLNGDGNEELVGKYYSMDGIREVFCIDRDSLKTKWQFLSPVHVSHIQVLDVDGDGKKELLCSTIPFVNNSSTINGLIDTKVWLFLLDCDGNLIWREELGNHPGFSGVYSHDDHSGEVFLVRSSTLNEENYLARVKVGIDGLEVLAKHHFDTALPPQQVSRQGSRVKSDNYIYLVDSQGRVSCYDSKLVQRYKYSKKAVSFMPLGLSDADGDGLPEMSIITLDGRLLWLDWKLREIGELQDFQYSSANPSRLLLIRSRDQYRLLVHDSSNNVTRIYDINRRLQLSPIFLYLILTLLPVVTFYQLRLRAIARQKVTLQKMVEKQTEDIKHQHHKLINSIRYARVIQLNTLTKMKTLQTRFPKSYCIWMPRDIVGGDFYWFHQDHESGKTWLALIDCTGHGVPGAFMSILVLSVLSQVFRHSENLTLAQRVVALYREVKSYLSTDEDYPISDGFVISIIEIDESVNDTKVVSLGQDFIVRQNGILNHHRKQACNLTNNWELFNYKDVTINYIEKHDNTCIYLYSDGVIDQLVSDNSTKRKLGSKGLLSLLELNLSMPEEHRMLKDILDSSINSHDQRDDITFLAVRVI